MRCTLKRPAAVVSSRVMRRCFALFALLLAACAPSVATPAYSAEGAATTGTFAFAANGGVVRQLSGTAYTTVYGEPSTGFALSMGVNEGTAACVVSLAFVRPLQIATYRSFVPGSSPTTLSFSSALNCAGGAWTAADASGRLEVMRADGRLVGRFDLLLTSAERGDRTRVRGRFDVANPNA